MFAKKQKKKKKLEHILQSFSPVQVVHFTDQVTAHQMTCLNSQLNLPFSGVGVAL